MPAQIVAIRASAAQVTSVHLQMGMHDFGIE